MTDRSRNATQAVQDRFQGFLFPAGEFEAWIAPVSRIASAEGPAGQAGERPAEPGRSRQPGAIAHTPGSQSPAGV